MARGYCYHCGAPATSREHFPPKAFFPRGGNLQLKTVRACAEHNEAKSHDDAYVLAHVSMNAASRGNLASRIFMASIAPQLDHSPGFRSLFSERMPGPGSAVGYRVDVARFDAFFDNLTCAVFFDRFRQPVNPATHQMRHIYPDLSDMDPDIAGQTALATNLFLEFFETHSHAVETVEADKTDEVVYRSDIVAPAGTDASVTIAHSFYGVFRVISLLTARPQLLRSRMGLR